MAVKHCIVWLDRYNRMVIKEMPDLLNGENEWLKLNF